MAYQGRSQNSSIRPSMGGSLQQSSGQSPMLVARISEKRAELENLKQLRDLSAGIAAQMQTLEEKLSLLSDGTEGLFQYFVYMPVCMGANGWKAVAAVLLNWHNVLRAINMASSGFIAP